MAISDALTSLSRTCKTWRKPRVLRHGPGTGSTLGLATGPPVIYLNVDLVPGPCLNTLGLRHVLHVRDCEVRASDIATGPSVIYLSTSPPRRQVSGRWRQEKRSDAPGKNRPDVPRRQEAQARRGHQAPLPDQLRRGPQSTRCVIVYLVTCTRDTV